MLNFPHQELTKTIIGIYYDVYNEMGHGFLEKVYQNSMIVELQSRGLKVESQKKINVFYKQVVVGEYIPDIIVNNSVIVELKCVEYFNESHQAQLINYLKSTECEVGLLLYFGNDPQFIRKIYTNNLKKRIKI
ncbi:MAG: GxxExxY protein [Flavobacterium sp.]|jgi:GxxExxY protein